MFVTWSLSKQWEFCGSPEALEQVTGSKTWYPNGFADHYSEFCTISHLSHAVVLHSKSLLFPESLMKTIIFQQHAENSNQ